MNFAKMKKDEIIWMSSHRCRHNHSYLEHQDCYLKDHPRQAKVGFLDIESFGLDASFGVLLSWAIKPAGDDNILHDVFKLSDLKKAKPGEEDRRIVESAVAAMKKFDLLITHYGNSWRFDVPFLRTRAASMDIAFPNYGDIKQLDTYPVLKSRFRLKSNRQEMAVNTLLGSSEKNHVIGWRWRAALRGDKESLDYIVDHNLRDVRDLEKLWNKIAPFSPERASVL